MVKQRILAVIIIKNGWAVQSIGFSKYLPLGKAEIVAEFLNEWGIDEISLIDIDATKNHRLIHTDIIKKVASKIFTPLSVAGGIKSIEDIKLVLNSGADKVIINTQLNNKDFMKQAISYFGKQCIVASVDVINKNNKYMVYDYKTSLAVHELLSFISSLDVGEILVNSVQKDGKKTGYDIELYKFLTSKIDIPIIALGGAKNPYDMRLLLDKVSSVSAVGASNFFHFYEHSVSITKAILKKDINRPIRHDGLLNYTKHNFDCDGRILKLDEAKLKNMLFEHYKREII